MLQFTARLKPESAHLAKRDDLPHLRAPTLVIPENSGALTAARTAASAVAVASLRFPLKGIGSPQVTSTSTAPPSTKAAEMRRRGPCRRTRRGKGGRGGSPACRCGAYRRWRAVAASTRASASLARAACAAPTREERNGRSRLPSPVVPSANSTMTSPFAEPVRERVVDLRGRPAALAVDEDGALQPRQKADRPARSRPRIWR